MVAGMNMLHSYIGKISIMYAYPKFSTSQGNDIFVHKTTVIIAKLYLSWFF